MTTHYLFDSFAFSTDAGLSRDGLHVHLPQSVQPVLLRLLEGAGRVVSRESLAEVCGDDATPAAVTRKIAQLRDALGHDRSELIRTVYGRGFRIAVPVSHGEGPPLMREPETAPSHMTHTTGETRTGEEMMRTAFELASQRSDERLQQAAAVLALTRKRFPTLALAPSLQADVEVARMVRGYVRPSTHADHVMALVDTALAMAPNMSSALATKGWLAGAIHGDIPEGLRLVDAALAASPTAWLASFYRVWLLIGKSELDGAMRELQQALAVSPLERGLLGIKAWLLLSQGRTADAGAFLDEVMPLRPDVDLLWLMRSILFLRMNRLDDASASMQRAIDLNRGNTFIDAHHAWLQAAMGDTASARDFVRRSRRPKAAYVSPVQVAMVLHALDDQPGYEAQRRVATLDRDPWRLLSWCDPRLAVARA